MRLKAKQRRRFQIWAGPPLLEKIPASVRLEGEYGLSGVACGVPCVIGRGGIEKIVELPLDAEERELLARSCDVIRQYSERAESV